MMYVICKLSVLVILLANLWYICAIQLKFAPMVCCSSIVGTEFVADGVNW